LLQIKLTSFSSPVFHFQLKSQLKFYLSKVCFYLQSLRKKRNVLYPFHTRQKSISISERKLFGKSAGMKTSGVRKKKTFLILEMEIDLFKHPFQLKATGSKFCLALDVREF
jgi:hypothetical protein